MINKKSAKLYCCEPLELIENYAEAVADMAQTWDCHHRLGIRDGVTVTDELKANNMYYHRPANELIFVTKAQHLKLHSSARIEGNKKGGKKQPREVKTSNAKKMNAKLTFKQRVKGGKKMLGKHAWNNGVISTWAFESPGPEWKRGRLPKKL